MQIQFPWHVHEQGEWARERDQEKRRGNFYKCYLLYIDFWYKPEEKKKIQQPAKSALYKAAKERNTKQNKSLEMGEESRQERQHKPRYKIY